MSQKLNTLQRSVSKNLLSNASKSKALGDKATINSDTSEVSHDASELVEVPQTARNLLTQVQEPTVTTTDLNLFGRAQYNGQTQNDVPHGQGELVWREHTFEGRWIEGRFISMIQSGNLLREGLMNQFKKQDDEEKKQPHRKDVIVWKNNQFYVGQTYGGKPQGWGHLTVSCEQFYEGEFDKGVYHGTGAIFIFGEAKELLKQFKHESQAKEDEWTKITGRWVYGMFEMNATSDIRKHLDKSLQQDQLADTVITPQNQQDILQTLPVQTQFKNMTVLACRDFGVIHKDVDAEQINEHKERLITTETSCHDGQKIITKTQKGDSCPKCKMSFGPEDVAFQCCEPQCQDKHICVDCVQKISNRFQILEKTKKHHFFKPYRLTNSMMVEDDCAHKISDKDKVYEIQFWTSHFQGTNEHRNFRQVDKIVIKNPVILDVKIDSIKNHKSPKVDKDDAKKNDQGSKDDKVDAKKNDKGPKEPKEPDFQYEKQMLFLDETQSILCWFTWKDQRLHLHELDLKAYNYDSIDQISELPETNRTLIRSEKRRLLKESLGIEQAKQNSNLVQWPKINGDLIAISGIQSDQQNNWNQSNMKIQPHQTDCFIFTRPYDQDSVIQLRSISLLLNLITDESNIKVYTLVQQKRRAFKLLSTQFQKSINDNEVQQEFSEQTEIENPRIQYDTGKFKNVLNKELDFESEMLNQALQNVHSCGFPHVLANIEETVNTSNIIFLLRTLCFGCEIIRFNDSNQTVKTIKQLEQGNVFGFIGNHLYVCEQKEVTDNNHKLIQFNLHNISVSHKDSKEFCVQLPQDALRNKNNKNRQLTKIVGLDQQPLEERHPQDVLRNKNNKNKQSTKAVLDQQPIEEKQKSKAQDQLKATDLGLSLLVTYKRSFADDLVTSFQTTVYSNKIYDKFKKMIHKQKVHCGFISQLVHPLLAHSSFLSNHILIANLAKDKFQSKICIAPYSFLCFVQTGLQKNGAKDDEHGFMTFIYFLALKGEKLSLLRLEQKAWHEEGPGKINEIKDNLMTDSECLYIEQAVVFLSIKDSEQLTADHLILRMNDSNYDQTLRFIALKTKETLKPPIIEQNITHHIVQGPFNEIYILTRSQSENNSEIQCIQQTEGGVLKKSTVYEHQCEIKLLQLLEQDELTWGNNNYIVNLGIIDAENKFSSIVKSDQKTEKFKESGKSISLISASQSKVIGDPQIDHKKWIIGQKSVTIPTLFNKNSLGQKFHLTSDTEFILEFLNLNNKEKVSRKCTDISMAFWSQRFIANIIEGDFSYFQIRKASETKNLHLFNAKEQVQSLNDQPIKYQVMNSKIIVISLWYCMVFDKKTLMLQEKVKHAKNSWQAKILQSYDMSHVVSFIMGQENFDELIVHRDEPDVVAQDKSQLELDNKDRTKEEKTLKEQKARPKKFSERTLEMKEILVDSLQDLVLDTNGDVIQFKFKFIKEQKETQNQDQLLKVVENFPKFEFDDFGLLEIFDLEEEKVPDLQSIRIFKPIEQEGKPNSETQPSVIDKIIEVEFEGVEQEEQFQVNALITEKFFVFKFNKDQIAYVPCSLDTLDKIKVSDPVDKSKKSEPTRSMIEFMMYDPNDKLKELKELDNKVEERTKLIPTRKWGQSETWDNGCRIDYARQQNSRVGKKKNVIQISTTDHLILYDLEKEIEVGHLFNYSRLTKDIKQFVDSGYQVYDLSKLGLTRFSMEALTFTPYQFSIQAIAHEKKNKVKKCKITHEVSRELMNCDQKGQLFVKPTLINIQPGNCFKLHSSFDIREIQHFIDNSIKKDTEFDTQTLLANINGLQTFQVFLSWPKHMEKIMSILTSQDYENDKNDEEDSFIQRLYLSLIQVQPQKFKFEKKELKEEQKTGSSKAESQKQKRLKQRKAQKRTDLEKYDPHQNTLNLALRENEASFSSLVKILNLSTYSNKSDIVLDFRDVQDLFKKNDQLVREFINTRFLWTPMTKNIDQIEWIKDTKQIAFAANSSILSEEEIHKQIYQQQKKERLKAETQNLSKQEIRVAIEIFRIDWLNGKVYDLYQHLSDKEDVAMYENNMIHAILIKSDYTYHIITQFILFLAQMVMTVMHHMFVLQGGYTEKWHVIITIVIVVLILQQVVHECIQLYQQGKKYIYQFSNQMQALTIFINLYLIYLGFADQDDMMSEQSEKYAIILPSIGASLLIINLVYWITLFPETSFYVTLFVESFKDIYAFLVILMIILMTFTIAVAVASNNANKLMKSQLGDYMEEEKHFTVSRSGNVIIDAFYSQWLLGLGEFEMLAITDESESLEDMDQMYLWMIFVLATLVSQIIMFNTLIAILGDTYSRIMEKRNFYALKARTEIFSDFMYMIWWADQCDGRAQKSPQSIFAPAFRLIGKAGFNQFSDNTYLYVITPSEEAQGEWEGSVASIKKRIEVSNNSIQSQNKSILKTINHQNLEIKQIKEDIITTKINNEKQGKNVQEIQITVDKIFTLLEKDKPKKD